MRGSAALRAAASEAALGQPVVVDVAGRRLQLDPADAARLRDRATASAGRSSVARDLAFLIDRALHGRRVLALHRSEAHTLKQLASDIGLAALAQEIESS